MSDVHLRRGPWLVKATDSGPTKGPPVVLLHGFPQRGSSWNKVVPHLHSAGLRTIVVDQRGYCSSARPRGRRPYAISELVGDVLALVDTLGLPSAHLVGHDWGAVVAWATTINNPGLVSSLTAISVPHPRAFLRSLVSSDQLLRSYYIALFQLPLLPEFLLARRAGQLLLSRAGMGPDMLETYRQQIVADGALPGALGWYRAIPFTPPGKYSGSVTVPTSFVWSDKDVALGRTGAILTEDYVDADYRFVEMSNVSHWIPEERPEELAEVITARVLGSQSDAGVPVRRTE